MPTVVVAVDAAAAVVVVVAVVAIVAVVAVDTAVVAACAGRQASAWQGPLWCKQCAVEAD
jgi:hypothetical protein